MSDYIKREDAVKALADMLAFEAEMDYCDTFTSDDFIDDAKGYFEDIPSADVEPVRHGRWRLVSRLDEVEWLYGAVIECSQCKHKGGAHYNYCPNCGAKMDGGDTDA